jgi:hypothetical protein
MSPGSLWLAAQALPCHATQTSTWASGELSYPLYLLLFSSMAMVSDPLVKLSEPSSLSLLSDADDESGFSVI